MSYPQTESNTTSKGRHEGKGLAGRRALDWWHSHSQFKNFPQTILGLQKVRWSICPSRIKGKPALSIPSVSLQKVDVPLCHVHVIAALLPFPSLLMRLWCLSWSVLTVWFFFYFLGNKSSRFVSREIAKAQLLMDLCFQGFFFPPNHTKWHTDGRKRGAAKTDMNICL